MASIDVIGKAQAAGLIMKQVLGTEPSYEYRDNYVRVYYPPDALRQVRSKLQEIATAPAGDMRIDWAPIVTPYAIKKVLPIAAGILFLGIMIGKRL